MNIFKRHKLSVMVLILIVGMLYTNAFAETDVNRSLGNDAPIEINLEGTVTTSGKCGTYAKWEFIENTDGRVVLHIFGSGAVTYSGYFSPWYDNDWIHTNNMQDIVIEGVSSIDNSCFSGINGGSVERVVVKNQLQTIGRSAFKYCDCLEYVYLSDSVTSLGMGAFEEASALKEVRLSKGLKVLESGTFADCTSLKTVIMQEGLQTLDTGAFTQCTGLEEVDIPSSVISVNNPFAGCTSLNTIRLSSNFPFKYSSLIGSLTSVKNIVIKCDGESFTSTSIRGNNDIEKIVIEQGVEIIGNSVFSRCSSLSQVILPDSLLSIGDYAFYNCSSLSNISLPEGLTIIQKGAFSGCNSLGNITIPGTVTSLGDSAFDGCSSFTAISLPESVNTIGANLFKGCSNLQTVTMSNALTELSEGMFYGCNNLAACDIPEAIASVGKNAFKDCIGLQSITIGSGVIELGESAFEGCNSLDSVIIPESVVTVGVNLFKGCSNLQTVTMSNTLTELSEGMFYACTNLGSIEIPESIETIGSDAFNGCSSLEYIYIPSSVSQLTENSINGYDNYVIFEGESHVSRADKVYEYVSKPLLEYWINLDSDASQIVIPNTIVKIPDRIFEKASDVAIMFIPDTVNSFSSNALNLSKVKRILYGGSEVDFAELNLNDTLGPDCEVIYLCTENDVAKIKSITDISFDGIENKIYIGNPITLELTGWDGTESLISGIDFTTEYSNNILPGTANVSITGHGFYIDTTSYNFVISKANTDNVIIDPIPDQSYTGRRIEPELHIWFGSHELSQGEDYSLEYFDNTHIGKASVLVTFGELFEDDSTLTATFDIIDDPDNPQDEMGYKLILNENDTITTTRYLEGETVTIRDTNSIEYKTFSNWDVVSGALELSDAQRKANPCNFAMPASDIEITAVYKGSSLKAEIFLENERYNGVLNNYYALENSINTYADRINQIMTQYGVTYLQSYSYYESKYNQTRNTISQKMERLARLRADTSGGHAAEIASLEREIAELNEECSMYNALMRAAEYKQEKDRLQRELNKINLTTERTKHENNVANICANHYVTDPDVAEIEYIRLDKDEYEYTGSEIHPIVTVIDANGNELGKESYDIVYPSDCISVGTHVIKLNLKGDYVGTKQKSFNIAKHTWSEWIITKEPTCTEAGSREKTCSDCEKKVVESIDPLGHDWKSKYTIDSEPTCTEEGSESIHCNRCDEIKNVRAIAKIPHSFTDWVILKEANCTETGLKERTCTVCSEKETEEIPITHEYGEAIVLQEPTCTEAGLQERECSICHYIGSEEIPALGHKWNTKYSIDKKATYTATGLKSIHCSVCDKVKPGSTVTIAKKEKVDLPKVTILTPVGAKRAATVKWKKVSAKNQKKISTIQIQYSTDKTFKKGVKKTTAKKSAVSKKIYKLSSKKKYYIRIRAYKKSGKITHVSKWSTVKYVKVK